MDFVDIALRLVGAFYVFAGYVAARATLTGMLIDRAIAAIGAKPPPRAETARGLWMLAMTALVFLAGAALVLKLKIALALFVACFAFQAVYLFYAAPKFLDPFDEPDVKGRQQSINAFVIYTVATLFVAWAYLRDRLLGTSEVTWPGLAIVGGLVVAHVGYTSYQAVKILGKRQLGN